jgi:MtN3 and saliva related transmembrane protein
MLAQSLGWTATFLFTICYIPQIMKTIRSRTVDGLSVWLFRIQLLANCVALSYATLIGQRPLQIKYTLALILLGVVLVILARFGKSKPEPLAELDVDLFRSKAIKAKLSTSRSNPFSNATRETLTPK